MRLLLVHPGASWSTHDVYQGVSYGLQQHGVQVSHYRLDQRIEAAHKALHALWRVKKREQADLPKPNGTDTMYHAGVGALEMALRLKVDVVLVISAMYLHPDVIIMMKRAGLRVVVLFTETPYDLEKELKVASLVDGCWTHERSCVETFRTVNPRCGYVPHGWHPEKHYPIAETRPVGDELITSHDVVFVGTGFPDRITFFNAIDWTGIDLGLYGTWKKLGLKADLVKRCVQAEAVVNEKAAALYRRAKIGLNLYRSYKGWGRSLERAHGESISPRGYELARCGVFHLSQDRAEVRETFGDLVPTFSTPTEAAALMRMWLADTEGRRRVAEALPACVAEASWTERSKILLGDLSGLLTSQAA